jgi:hypothetical protein
MSMHDTQVPGPVPKQSLFTQSAFTAQCFVSTQGGHAVPPQSTSVSLPSLTPSAHVAAMQVLFEQTPPPAQSASTLHATQVPLALQTVPPLSVHAVPVAALVVPHVVAAHVLTRQREACAAQSVGAVHSTQAPLEHTVLAQSLGTRHVCPFPHAGHCPPPQSTPVSVPSITPSVQLAAGGASTPVSAFPFASMPPLASCPGFVASWPGCATSAVLASLRLESTPASPTGALLLELQPAASAKAVSIEGAK